MSDVGSIVFLVFMIVTFVLGIVVGKCIAYDEIYAKPKGGN